MSLRDISDCLSGDIWADLETPKTSLALLDFSRDALSFALNPLESIQLEVSLSATALCPYLDRRVLKQLDVGLTRRDARQRDGEAASSN